MISVIKFSKLKNADNTRVKLTKDFLYTLDNVIRIKGMIYANECVAVLLSYVKGKRMYIHRCTYELRVN